MSQDYFIFKTSFAQERLWFLDQFAPGNPFYNIHVALPLSVDVDPTLLKRSLGEIVRRHEALRTTFVVVKGEPVQAIAPALDLELKIVDLRGRPLDVCQRTVDSLAREESQRPFNLATGPLLRTVLVQLDSPHPVLLLTIHHIVSDGWSMDLFTRELRALYDAFSAGRPSPLPDLPIQYADFATWQREWLQGDVLNRQIEYWRQQLASAPRLLELPSDRPRPPIQTYAGAYQSTTIPASTITALRQVTREQGATLFMALAAVFALLLYRYTDQEDIVIGTPIANRNRPEVQHLIGFFVNTLVLRIRLAGNPDFREVLRRFRAVALEAYQHQDLPFEKLVAELAPERHLSHSPLFQVMFVHQASLNERPAEGSHPSNGGFHAGMVERGTAKFDLTLFTSEIEGGKLAAVVEYNTDLFDDHRMSRLLGHFEVLLRDIGEYSARPIGLLTLLTEAERHDVMQWSGRRTPYPRDASVHELVAAQAAVRPDAPAVVFGDQTVSYRGLLERAGALAHRLVEVGATSDRPIAVCMDRSIDFVVAVLGILAAGAAYVPLDPKYPLPRLRFMIDDTQTEIIVTERRSVDRLPPHRGARVLVLDDPAELERLALQPRAMPKNRTSAASLAYIMYTSGSTGVPKGVSVVHRGIVRLTVNTNYVKLTPNDSVLHFAPASFDASTFEIWGALLNGARLVVCPPGVLSIDDLAGIVEREQVTTMWLTANLFQEVVDADLRPYRAVRQLLAGGDVLSPQHVGRARNELPDCQIINGYGPTEGTTFSCCRTVTDADCRGDSLPIGSPVANSVVRVLDARFQLVPVGNIGELFIGGDGLARGYWRRDDLTAERFVADPFGEPGALLYRSGDTARWRADGVLEFVGRRDHQVKVRGFRVEPGEVEMALLTHPNIRGAAVISSEDGSAKRLIAHVVTDPTASVTVTALRRFLQDTLPDYMVPSAFVLCDRFPLTPSGKVDRAALARTGQDFLSRDAAYEPPASDVEQTITKIWRDVLGGQKVGVNDNFFELGGHSLLMVRVQRLLADALKMPLKLVDLFQFPTIRSLANHVAARAAEPSALRRVNARAARQREAMQRRRGLTAARQEPA